MDEFVHRGLEAMANALLLALDYFRLPQEEFLRRWLPDRDADLARQTKRNAAQQRIVADDRERTNVLVLAGPGAGKTRVLVHTASPFSCGSGGRIPRGVLDLV